jgi:hypothetical protein
MRYLHLRLVGAATDLHPLVGTLTDPDVLRDAKMLDWAPSFDPPRTTTLLYVDGDLDHLEGALRDADVVLDHDVTRLGDERGYAYVHAEPHPTEWELFEVTWSTRLVPVFPFQYHRDGSLSVWIVGPSETLQAAVDATPSGVEATLERVGEYDLGRPPIPPRLPRRQREALTVALELGYYEVPRTASREDVAERLDCAPSTASEHLQKAERRVVRTYLQGDE